MGMRPTRAIPHAAHARAAAAGYEKGIGREAEPTLAVPDLD